MSTKKSGKRDGRGGRRPGAGRKPKNGVAGVGHRTRAALAAKFPVHVTMKLLGGLPALRAPEPHRVLLEAFAACGERHDDHFRIVQFAILDGHLHLLVEARDRAALNRGMQGFTIRTARNLNKLWGRRGTVYADRYLDRILKTPREVREALVFLFDCGRTHPAKGRLAADRAIDLYTSAPWFDGFRDRGRGRGIEDRESPCPAGRTRLLAEGWRRDGLLSIHDRARPSPSPQKPGA